tara:strand:+ start:367 stop:897 length:531 start_codon:yes stop_codon:yes gene_type:complete
MTNQKIYHRFVEILEELKTLKPLLKSKDITVSQLENYKDKNDGLRQEASCIVSYLYESFRKFLKGRDDLVGYGLHRDRGRYNYYAGVYFKIRSDKAIVVKTEEDNGEGYQEKGESFVIPYDFIFDIEAYEKRRKIYMLEGVISCRKEHNTTLRTEMNQSMARLKTLEEKLKELKGG